MYHVSAQGIDERMINAHYYYYYTRRKTTHTHTDGHNEKQNCLSLSLSPVLFLCATPCVAGSLGDCLKTLFSLPIVNKATMPSGGGMR